MPRVEVVFYADEDGTSPVLSWLDELEPKALAKCRVRIERLAELGNELRRPEADLLRDGIHELRVSLRGRNYRLLYFFHGRAAAVIAHGITKERAVPAGAIDLAIERKKKFMKDPDRHTYRED